MNPRNSVSSIMLYTENNTDLAVHIHQPILIIFGRKQLWCLHELSSAYLIYHVRLLLRP